MEYFIEKFAKTPSRVQIDFIKIFQFALLGLSSSNVRQSHKEVRIYPFTFPSGERGPRAAVNEESSGEYYVRALIEGNS